MRIPFVLAVAVASLPAVAQSTTGAGVSPDGSLAAPNVRLSASPAAHYFDAAWDGASALRMPQDRVPGRAIVKLVDMDARVLAGSGPSAHTAAKALAAIEADSGVRIELVRPLQLGWGLFEIRDASAFDSAAEGTLESTVESKARPDEALTLSLIEVLRDDDRIADVVADRWYRPLRAPNDPGFEDMWHLDAIGATAAWDMTTGLSSQRVGVVDTGTLRNHVDLVAKDITGWDFISTQNAAGDGDGRDSDYQDEGDGADCGNGPQGDSWHGSHVAGTILASADNGRGVPGINWAAGLVTARAMGKCGGSLTDIMDAAAWLGGANVDGVPNIGADKVSVMNLSLGGADACSGYEQDIVNWLAGQGTIFVAAAGNDGGAVGSPANCSSVITVAAHGPGTDRQLTGYSSFGTSVEVVAPGGVSGNQDGVLSVVGPGDESWEWAQGTSMAAPHVTAAVSLMQLYDSTLDRAALAQLFIDNGSECAGCQGVPALRLDLLLNAVGTGPVDDPVDPDPVDPPVTDPPTDPVVDDAQEPNDSFDQMSPVSCGQVVQGIVARDNLDWHELQVAEGTELELTLVGGAPDFDLYLTNGPTDANVLDSSRGPTGDETITTVASGTLAIVVAPYGDAVGDYSLTIGCTAPGVDDPLPPDDDVTDPDESGVGPSLPDDGAPDVGDPDPADDTRGAGASEAPAKGTAGVQGGCAQTSASSVGQLLGVLMLFGFVARRRRR